MLHYSMYSSLYTYPQLLDTKMGTLVHFSGFSLPPDLIKTSLFINVTKCKCQKSYQLYFLTFLTNPPVR